MPYDPGAEAPINGLFERLHPLGPCSQAFRHGMGRKKFNDSFDFSHEKTTFGALKI